MMGRKLRHDEEHPEQFSAINFDDYRADKIRRNKQIDEARMKPGTVRVHAITPRPKAQPQKRKTKGYDHNIRARLLDLWANRCAWCSTELDSSTVTVDHVKPLAKGGDPGFENLAPACLRCNGEKGNKPLLMFLLARRPAALVAEGEPT